MPRGLCIAGLVIAALLLLLFGLDLLASFVIPGLAPFRGTSLVMDAVFVVCAIGLAYLSWSSLKEQT
jgi:hypothetical protein